MTQPNPFLEEGKEPQDTAFLFVTLPGSIEPVERDASFVDPIDADLRVAGLGYVSGAGTQLGAPDSDGDREIKFAGVDVETIDVDACRELLRDYLVDLGCPSGTRIQFESYQDRFDGKGWHVDEPRDENNP